MSHFDCCRFRQASSGDLPNSRVVDVSKQPQALILNPTPTSSRSTDDLPPIRDIFAASNLDSVFQEDQVIVDSHIGPNRVMLFKIRHKESNGKLHEIARVIRSRISRESDISKQSSEKSDRKNPNEEEAERRKELKRALHRRLENEILQDRAAGEDGYDSDAVPIKTPRNTWGRGRDDIRDFVGGHVVGRFEPSSPSLGKGSSQRDYPQRNLRHRPVSLCTRNYTHEQKDQVQNLPPFVKKRLPQTMYDGPCSEIPSQMVTPKQSMYMGQRLDSQHRDSHLELRKPSLERPSHLHPSRSANFVDLVSAQNRSSIPTASRRRSIQNILYIPNRISSIEKIPQQDFGHTRWPSKWSRGSSRLLSPSIEAEEVQHPCECKNKERLSIGIQHDEITKEMPFTGPKEIKNSFKHQLNAVEEKVANLHRAQSFSLKSQHDTQVTLYSASKLLMPSVSMPCLEKHAAKQEQQLSAGNGSSLHYVKSRRGRQDSSSDCTHLKVPDASKGLRRDVTSSKYSSQNDSLASSRRSSLKRIQNLSERLEYLKSHPENEDHVAWSSALDVSRGSGSQFETVEIENPRKRTSELERSHLGAAMVAPKSTMGNSRNSSINREVIDIRAKPRQGDAEGKLHPESHKRSYRKESRGFDRRSSSVLDRTAEWYPSNSRKGHGFDFVHPTDEEASSIWEKALRAHAQQNSSLSASIRNVSPARSRQSLGKRIEGNTTPQRRPTLRKGIRFSSSDLWKRWRASSVTEQDSSISMGTSKPEDRTLKNRAVIPPASWSRFPSHTLAERCFSPAGKEDQVSSRDFALEFPAKNSEKNGKSDPFGTTKRRRSMKWGNSIMNKLRRIYDIDIRRINRGHRSSISVEGRLEYPELEILPHSSPLLQPLNPMSKHDIATVLESLQPDSSQPSVANKPDLTDDTFHGARVWSKLYEDCVLYPTDGDSLKEDASSDKFPPDALSESSRYEEHEFSPRSSADMRNSTLNFQQSLQDHEAKAKERALQAAETAWGECPAP